MSAAEPRPDMSCGRGWAILGVSLLIVAALAPAAAANNADGYGVASLGEGSVGGGGVAVFVRAGDTLHFTVTDDTLGLYYDLIEISLVFTDVTVELCPDQLGVVVWGRADLCGSLSADDLESFPGGWAAFTERLDAGDATLEIWSEDVIVKVPPTVIHSQPVVPISVDHEAFADTVGSVHNHAIVALAGAGAVNGYDDGTFGLDDPVTRGQLASMVARTLGLPGRDAPTFSDVAGSVHEPAISALAWREFVLGRADGTFGPNQPVTRAQAAAVLARAMEPFATGSDIPDIEPFGDLNGSVFKGHVEVLWLWGIANGCAEGAYCPDATLTRGQAASLVARTFGWEVVTQRR